MKKKKNRLLMTKSRYEEPRPQGQKGKHGMAASIRFPKGLKAQRSRRSTPLLPSKGVQVHEEGHIKATYV